MQAWPPRKERNKMKQLFHIVPAVLALCITACLGFSLILNRLIFPGLPSFYPLELPPLRRPRFLRRLPLM